MSPPTVRIVRLTMTFDVREPWPWSPARQVHAVKPMDLEIFPDEILAVVGQSGSGKTTLSRIVLGLEEPSGGEVWLEEQRWDHVPEATRQAQRVRYQYIPQDAMAALDPQQSALEHIIETLRALDGHSRAEALRCAVDMLDRLGLSARHAALPREMSGGEQRRVTLARVLALRPRFIVADEPTSGLDPERRDEVLEALVGNLPGGSCCLLVTHDMAAARRWCTRAIVMLDGHVIEAFDPRCAEPLHPYGRLLYDPWTGPQPSGELSSTGCPFLPDCTLPDVHLRALCATAMPSLASIGETGHRIACHVLAKRDQDTSTPPPSPPGASP